MASQPKARRKEFLALCSAGLLTIVALGGLFIPVAQAQTVEADSIETGSLSIVKKTKAPHSSNLVDMGPFIQEMASQTPSENAPVEDGSDMGQFVLQHVPIAPPPPPVEPPEENQSAAAEANPLAGKPIRYLIGASSPGLGEDESITVVAYDVHQPVAHGTSIAYCNLFDETNSGNYGPYLESSPTAALYNEGQIDPNGPGWERHLREQFSRRRAEGFKFIDLDNPDAYAIEEVLGAIDLAASYGLKVIAKNPGLMDEGALAYVSHAAIYGIVVEENAGTPEEMDALRRKAGKPNLPVWFIAFGEGRKWADETSLAAKNYPNMSVTYSATGEYATASDLVLPSDKTSVATQ